MTNYIEMGLLAAKQHGVVHAVQLEQLGFTQHQIRGRVRRGELRRVHRQVFALAGTRATLDQRAAAAGLAVHPSGAVSHRTAANRWKFRTVDIAIDVSVRYPRRLTLAGVTVHRSRDLEPGDITWVDNIPVTTPERTIADLGLIFPDSEVQRILDHAVATGLVTRRDMHRLRDRIAKQGRNGAGTLDRVNDQLPELAEETESAAEVEFLRMCQKTGLDVPILQLPVVVGGRQFRVDFAYPMQRIFIEIDGKATHGELEQIASDGGRQNLLVANGWTPIRFVYRKLRRDPDDCASTVRNVLRSVNQNRAVSAA